MNKTINFNSNNDNSLNFIDFQFRIECPLL